MNARIKRLQVQKLHVLRIRLTRLKALYAAKAKLDKQIALWSECGSAYSEDLEYLRRQQGWVVRDLADLLDQLYPLDTP